MAKSVLKMMTADDPLALALRFCSASKALLALKSSAPFLMRQRHFARSCALCSGMLKSFKEIFRVSL